MQDENVWMMNYKDEEECRWDLLKRPYIIAASFTECPDGGVELTKYIKTAGAAKTSIMVVCAELLASVARNMVRLAVPEKVKFINNIRDVAIRHLFDGMSEAERAEAMKEMADSLRRGFEAGIHAGGRTYGS